ncbi:MAG: AAA family ATPase [Xanthomonadales bacterium]|nr:AAA family ATPase [Xanthomonadales bacterium]
MYLQYFGLTEAPFSITPDPAFVYLSAAHRDALAHLMYGVGQGGSGGFVQLTGEVGTGKTTLCRCLLEQVPEDCRVALVLNPLMTPRELLATICEELGVDIAAVRDSNKGMVDALNAYLLDQHARGRRVVVVIDEAQNLSPDALEQVRLLTNLETAKDKLLQMVLLGQPELRQLLQRQNLRQLAQRITARYHLAPLNADETRAYVLHRMKVAGAPRSPFRKSALRALYQRSGGVPRLINIIADRALAAAYAREAPAVTARMVHAAANEVQPSEDRVRSTHWPLAAAAGLVTVALVAGAWYLAPEPWRERLSDPADDAAPRPATAQVAMGQRTAAGEPAAQSRPEGSSGPVTPPGPADGAGGRDAPGEPDPAAGPQLAVGGYSAAPEPIRATERLDPDWLDRQHAQAWRAVAELWKDGGSAHAVQSACDGAVRTGFACIRDQGNWSRIRQLGLPVLLVLRGTEPRLLLLRGFDGDALLLGSPGQERSVLRDRVEDQWLGEFLVAWPQAPDWPAEIRRGESGTAVDIVMEMAGHAEPAWQGDRVFDVDFEDWLTAFQRRNGLEADGIIGPNTLIHLMAPTIDAPRLVLQNVERS